MDCSCDAVEAEIFKEGIRIARKPHVCCECGSPIDTGEKYRNIRGRWDGEWATFKQCECCAEIWDDNHPEHGHCMAFGAMWDFLGS